jgi:hypothetical protein
MNNPRPSIFRNALQISPDFVANLSDEQLNQLMGRLLLAEAYKCKSPISEIRTNTELKASDDGCDGWTTKPEEEDEWLGSTNTCWQFKAGVAGEPARLKNEVTKKIPQETLASGERFVVIACGSTNGKKGEDERRSILVEEARAIGLPTENIVVIGSERLTTWCNQNPAVAAYFSGRPSSLWTFVQWTRSEEHQVAWQASEAVQSQLVALRTSLDFFAGEIKHLHIQGLPGVGKTRFVLELCRGAMWCNSVVYAHQAADISLNELIDEATSDKQIQLMLVADEVQTNQLERLRESIGQGNGRIRLITIGHGNTPDPTSIPSQALKPLDHTIMGNVVKGWHPNMPIEHVDFVVRFSDGYVRLALLSSNAVARNPAMNVRELLNRDEIRGFLDQMLGSENRQPLYVVAVLTNIGWTEDKQIEAEAVSRHLGLDWNYVRYIVDKFHRQFGIVPRGGRFRYISPIPLGIHLAVEAWNTYPDLLRSLPEVLPSDEAIDAYYTRLQSMASNPNAREFAREELSRFFRLDNFLDARASRRWSAISAADPAEAARNIFRALVNTTIEDRTRIIGDARRQIVSSLVRLAWNPSSFQNAVKALSLLAEAENESWANNATGEFVDRFQIYLGGTAMSYQQRLLVLDELIAISRPTLTRLVVKALSKIGDRQWSRMESGPASDEVPEREWQPRSTEELLECINFAVTRLRNIAKMAIPEIQDDLVAAADSLSMMLREPMLRNGVSDFFISVNGAYPQTRESLRRIIAHIIQSEKNYWKAISPEDLLEIESLHNKFQESSLEARLLQYVGLESWDPEEKPDLQPIAEELLSNTNQMAQHWPWLTSGAAGSGWLLGKILATIDTKGILAEIMPMFPNVGPDLRLLCAYIGEKRNELGDEWFDKWVQTQLQREPKQVTLFFAVAWRCGITEFTGKKLVEILRNQEINPQIVGGLAYGNWSERLSADVLGTVLWALTETGYRETAIGILMHRIQKKTEEFEFWDPLALQLITSPDLIRSYQMVIFYWKEVAIRLVPIHATEIATAILLEHAGHRSTGWMLEFSDAAPVLGACFAQNPIEAWNIIRPYLSSPEAHRFTFTFPRGLLEHIPADVVLAWISEQAETRAEILSSLLSLNFSSDESIASQVLGKYGDVERIAASFFSNYTAGSWEGPESVHWEQLANALNLVNKRTTLAKLGQWAIISARHLRQMAERERQREEEENIRRR